MDWEYTETGYRCTGHGIEFPQGQVCHECAKQRDEVAERRPVSKAAQRLYLESANASKRSLAWAHLAAAAIKDGELGHGAKMGTLELQWERLATERRDRADEIEADAELLRHDRDMAGMEKAH